MIVRHKKSLQRGLEKGLGLEEERKNNNIKKRKR
jgi:hypothetical protein